MPTIRLTDTSLHYIDRGHGPAVILLLHAFPMSSAMWQPQVDVLSRRHRVIAPDVRGFGSSGEPPESLLMSSMADDVWHLIDTLGIGKVVVCGLSMGGYVAFELWRRAPELFAGLVLADTRATADDAPGRENRERFAQGARAHGMAWVADEMMNKLLRPAAPPGVVAEVRRIILQGTPAGVAAAQRGMALRADSTGLLAQIDVPTLAIVGAEDALTPPAVVQAMASKIPEARLETIPEAGHLSNLEAPAPFAAAVLRHVDTCTRLL